MSKLLLTGSTLTCNSFDLEACKCNFEFRAVFVIHISVLTAVVTLTKQNITAHVPLV